MAVKNTIGIGVEISDNGTARKTIKSVEDLHSTIKKTQATAEKGVNVGGTAGSRKAVAAAYKPSGALESAEITEYGRMRGTVGNTGASARDFANQAQGLGGLVRLYATYAANIFAVSAAFNALSNAMDTANMVRGLDQLGAASGTALGSLSKRLVEATDGAISLREAMEATAKASSSGMSSDQILRMGQVAKQASQALGVDMSDAISRISRGITKLEPELLDELGLFTKTGQAASEYAKSVGKSVTQLTDFERRAAFANAVLEEGERKFGDIKLDTNPYTQLLASIKNLGQEALEVVNKVLAPLVGYLSASPAALATAVGGLAAVLLKQALPAIGEFKAGLASAAEAATELSIRKAQDAAEARKKLDSQVLQQIEILADEKVARVDEAEQKILSLEKSGISKRSAAYKLLQKDIDDVNEADFAAVESRARAAEKAGRLEQASSYREVIAAVKEQKAAEDDLIQTKKRLHAENMKAAEGWGVYGTTIQAAQRAQQDATKANIVSNAAYNGSLIGVRGAISLMKDELANSDVQLTRTQRTLLLTRGGFAAVGGAVSTLVSRLGTIGMVLGLVTAAFSIVDSMFTKNSQEAAKLSSSLGRTEDSLKNLGSTLDFINKKPFLDQMSPESLSARATALREVSDSISSATDSLLAADKASSGWDRFIDGWKSLWGGDLASKFAESTSKGLFSTLTKLSGSKEAETLKKELSKILNIDPKSLTLDKLQNALESAAKTAPEKLKQVKQAFDEISKSAQISAAKSTELVDSFKKLDELRTNISNSFMPKDDLTKFGLQLLDNFQKLSIALEDPVQRLNAIRTLAKEIVQIPGTGLSDAIGMADLAKDAEQAQIAQAKLLKINQDLVDKEAELAKFIGDSNKARKIAEGFGKNVQVSGLTFEGKKDLDALIKDLNSLRSSKQVTVKVVTELTGKIDASAKQIESAQLNVFKSGAKIVSDQLSAEWAKAGSTIASAYASVLSGTETGIRMRANADRAVINAQIAQIESQRSLTIATRELAVQMKEDELRRLKDTSSGRYDQVIVSQAEGELETMRKGLAAARAGSTKGLVAQMSKDLAESPSSISKQSTQETLQFAQSMEASGAAIANLRAQIAAINIGEKFQQFELQTKLQAEALQDSLKSLEIDKEAAQVLKQKNGEYSKEYIQAKQDVEQKILAKQQEVERLTLIREILKYEQAGSKVEADKVRAKLAEVLLRQKEISSLQLTNQELEKIDIKLKQEQQTLDRITKLESIRLSGTTSLLDAQRDIADISLNTAEQTGKFTKQYLAEKQYELAINKSIEEQKRAEDAATYSARTTQQRLAAEYEAEMAKTEGKGSGASKFILDQMATEAAAYGNIVTALNNKTIAQNIATTSLKQYNDEQTRFAESLESLKGLDNIFEGLGTKIAEAAEAFKAAADSQKQYSASISDMEFERDAAATAKERISWENKISKAQKEQQKDEISGYAKSVGAAKAMFKEKTTAHKALAAVEKVLHLQRLAMDLKEMVQKLFTDGAEATSTVTTEAVKTSATSAGFLARTGTYISEIFAKFSAAMGPWGWAAAAGVVAAIFGGSGKGKSSFVPSAEQRQETQGTALSYNSEGALVQTSRGVFGDTSAKSESIVNSLEIIRDNSTDGLDYDNKMLRALTGLKNALDTAAKGLYGITGLRAGSLSGIVEGTNTGGGFLGIGGLFSKSVSKSIVDSGIKLSGSLKDLIEGVTGSIQTFETVSTTIKKSGFFGIGGSTKTTVSTAFKNLDGVDQKAFQSIVNAFGYAGDLLYEVAATAGTSAEKVTSAISTIRVDELASLRGLTGEDFSKELGSVIGKVLDEASYAIFTEFEQFANFGEGMLETVVRVVDANKKISQALINIGSTSGTLTGKFDVTEALVTAAGGLDVFLDRAEFFRRNFLTEAQQLAPIQSAVAKELSRLASLGYTSADGLVDTRVEFKKLVQTLQLDASPAAVEAYTALMGVAEGFYEVTEATQTALQATVDKFKEFADSLREFRDNLVLGSQSILTPLQKYAESKLQFEDTYTKALAGDEVAQGKLTGAAQTFLTASKDYFASSAQYTQDFNNVLDKVGVGITSAESQISIAERQLNGITEQVGLLTQINENIAYIAGVPQAATGGRVSGLTFVGERGAELVNFTNSATVYSAEQTRGMFAPQPAALSNMSQVVTELRQVKQEISQLRQEQKQQTGDLIVSNYDANNRAAQDITTEVSKTAISKEWQERNKVVVI